MSDMQDARQKTVQESNHAESSPATGATARSVLDTVFAHWAPWLPALGSIALLAHFWRIGYAPSLSFADLGTVLGAMLLSTTLAFLAFAALMLLPLFTLMTWIDGGLMRGPPKPVPDHLRASNNARKARHRRVVRGKTPRETGHPALRADFSSGSLASFITAGIASFVCYALVFFFFLRFAEALIAEAVIALFAVFGFVEVFLALAIDAPYLRRYFRVLRRSKQQWGLLFIMYMGTWPMVLLPFMVAGGEYLESQWSWLLLTLLLIPLLHWIWFAAWRVKKPQLLALKIMPILLVLAISGIPMVVIDITMNAFGLGMIPRVDVVLTARGCDIAHAAWPQRACVPQRRDDLDAYRLENIEVLTRIGAHYYVGAPGAMRNDALVRFPIPSDEVLSWRRRPDVPKPATPTKPAKPAKP